MAKTTAPCPHCGAEIIQNGEGKHPCSYCGKPLPTEGQRRWIERIHADLACAFDEPDYAVAPDGIVRIFLNGLVFVCTTDSRCHLEVRQTGGGPPSDFKDLMIWRDEHGLDGSYEATYDALVGDN